MLKFSVLFSLILCLVSCVDLSKKNQLTELTQLSKRVDSIQQEFELLKKDTISEIIYTMNQTSEKIKTNIGDDTLTLQIARKLDSYKKVYRKLTSIEAYEEKFLFGSQDIKNSIEKLSNDITKGSGDREKYDQFLSFERSKVLELEKLLSNVKKLQSESIETFQKIHPAIASFADQLSDN
jgi:hypothetical protein